MMTKLIWIKLKTTIRYRPGSAEGLVVNERNAIGLISNSTNNCEVVRKELLKVCFFF